MKKSVLSISCAAMMMSAVSSEPLVNREDPAKYWDFSKLEKAPAYRLAPERCQTPGLKAVLIEGYGPAEGSKNYDTAEPDPLSKKVKAEFFAYIGIPEGPVPEGGFPGIVMIHGGGGTAYPGWTQLWVKKGFAVIALNWYNQMSVPKAGVKNKNDVAREPLPGGKRNDHVSNIANMVLAHSLLRSLKEVNPEKTAFVGLSWGSWFGSMLASVDPRFKGGVQIYCGDVKETKTFINGRFLHASKFPMFWVVSTNDQNATVESLGKGFKECATLDTKSIVIDLPHDHIGFSFDSCERMASFFTKGETPLPKLSDIELKGNIASCKILRHGKGIKQAVLCYTDSTEQKYHLRKWQQIPAEIKGDTITVKVPEKAHSFYISAYEGESKYHDLCGSTQPVVLPFSGQ